MTGRRAAALAKSGPGEGGNLLPALHNLSGGIGGERAQAMDDGIYIIRTPADAACARSPTSANSRFE